MSYYTWWEKNCPQSYIEIVLGEKDLDREICEKKCPEREKCLELMNQ
jgi:hypothetical protein